MTFTNNRMKNFKRILLNVVITIYTVQSLCFVERRVLLFMVLSTSGLLSNPLLAILFFSFA